jgi:hypothetical protein
MSEVAGPTSPVEQCDPHADAVLEPPFVTVGEGSKTEDVTQNTTEATAPTQAPEPPKDTLVSPPIVSPDASPASPSDQCKVVSANPPPPELATGPSTPPQSVLTSNHHRVVSFDRGHTLQWAVSLDRYRELLAEMDGRQLVGLEQWSRRA